MEVFVLVKNFGLVNDGVNVFRNRKDVLKAFRKYTSFSYGNGQAYRNYGDKNYSKDFEQTIIQKVEL